jgi:hypothetical protein
MPFLGRLSSRGKGHNRLLIRYSVALTVAVRGGVSTRSLLALLVSYTVGNYTG